MQGKNDYHRTKHALVGGPAAYALSGRTAAFFHAPKNQRTLAEAMKKPTKSANRAAGMV